MNEIIVARQFRGPPHSGNGGYVCGLMGRLIDGPSTAILRAPIPLDTPHTVERDGQAVRLLSAAGELLGEARPAGDDALPTPPAPPNLERAIAAGRGFPGLERPFHPICFTCGDQLVEGEGLRVFTGQVPGGRQGFVAGPWTPHIAFADERGLIRPEVVWAALDCPGSVAWVVMQGGGGMLGTMTCEVVRPPAAGETCIVTAWPIEQSGRKKLSGTALFSADGELLARSHHVWIGRPMQAAAA
ncbi:MAG: hypothetical protein ACHP84_00270 [Caulobacterales bacterium]